MHKPLTAAGLTAAVAGALLVVPVASITVARPATPTSAGRSASPTHAKHEIDQPADAGFPIKEADVERSPLSAPFSGHRSDRWPTLVADRAARNRPLVWQEANRPPVPGIKEHCTR